MSLTEKMKERFLEKIGGGIPDTNGCIKWTGNSRAGYGRIKIAGKQVDVHRLSYMVFVGPMPEGKIVCHTCDCPSCYNPKHLYAGTHSDNRMDSARRGRAANIGWPKLTVSQVMEIRDMGIRIQKRSKYFAEKFGVARSTIVNVIKGRTYTNLVTLARYRP